MLSAWLSQVREGSAKIQNWRLVCSEQWLQRVVLVLGPLLAGGCLSRRTLWLSLVRSTQIRTLPSDFGTTTMPEHQSVGSWIFEITPRVSIRSSSCLTAPMSGTATRLEVDRANGLAPGSSWIVYSPSSFPSPVNSFGNSTVGSRVGSSLTTATRETRFSCSMAGRPKRDLVKPLTTYTFSCAC